MMKTILKTCFGAVVLLSSVQAFSQSDTSHKLTLKQCVETAIGNNLQVKQQELLSETAGVTLRQSKHNLLPDLNVNLGHGYNSGRSIDPFTNQYINQQVTYANFGINSNTTLFSGFQLQNTIKQNSLALQATKMEVQQTKESVTLSVILAYLQILNNQDQLAQANNQAEVTRKQLERLDVLNKAGAIIPALYYDLRGQLASDELTIITTRNSLDAARLALAQLMNVPFDKSLTVEQLTAEDFNTAYAGDPATIFATAASQLSLIKGVELRRQSAEKGVKVARGNAFPGISFSTGQNTNYSDAARMQTLLNTAEAPSGDFVTVNGSKVPVITQRASFRESTIGYFNQFKNNRGTSFFVNLNIPILNGFRTKNRVALAKINVRNAEYVAQTTRTQLSQAIEQAYFNMNAAIDRYKILTRQVEDFTESFRIAEVRFNAGAITQVDYIVAKNNVDRARINLIIARYDFAFRAKILDYYQGRLVL